MKEKETIRRFIVNERAVCDSHTKWSGTVPLENWRTCVVVHMLKRGWHSPRIKKIWFKEFTAFKIKQKQLKVKRGRKAHEVLKRFCPGVSKQFFKSAAGSNIDRSSNKITILWYKRKHWWNYCTKINLQQIYGDDSTTIKSCILFPLLFN